MFKSRVLAITLALASAGCLAEPVLAVTNGIEVPQDVSQIQTVKDLHGKIHGLGLRKGKHRLGVTYWSPNLPPSAPPAAYDLRTLHWVAPVRDQGSCGSCWAFSITKTLESALLRAGKTGLDLSEQTMVSCDKNAYGCNGGMMDDMDYVVKTGLPLETDFPYRASDASCKSGLKPVAQGKSWGYVGAEGREPTTDEIKAALLDHGVLSVTVAAGGTDWNGGNGGEMTHCNNRGVNHMVNLIGFRDDGKLIGRNSWGTDWGDKGDFYAKQGCNQLGSGDQSVSYVVVDAGPGPTPPQVRLPAEVDVMPDTEIAIGVRGQDGVSYSWTADGTALADTSSVIYVTPTKDTLYSLKAHNDRGDAQSTVKVHVLPSPF